MKKIAVIMSIYVNDHVEFTQKAVESILQQTYSNFDYYILADGRLDTATEVYLTTLTDSRIHFTQRNENKGLARSLNELLAIVLPQGYEYIARMDADDISLPERFEKQVEFMETHPTIDCVGTAAIEIRSDGSTFYHKSMPLTHEECLNLFRTRDCLIHPTVMFRKTYFDKAGLYPEDTYFAEDTIMWSNGFANGCRFANLPDFLFRFRLDEHFFDRRRGWKHAKSIIQVRKRVNKQLHLGWFADLRAYAYGIAKLMPQSILQKLYKLLR